MIGEREDILNENQYGDLTMRQYDINGNTIDAFYDDSDDLIFVLDNTINQTKPNVLLVINPAGDKKWDEILSSQYNVDLETIRPKQDNKYQKLDIEYSGLSVYENLINAFVAGDDLSEHLVQLDILRNSAARHSAMTRLNAANEVISKTNVTIVKTKESIVRLQNRIKTLRAKLSATKKEIGKVSTKQSAAKILKLESQIEATNEKLKRAEKRLDSAQKRLETATVDAELASDLLNQPVPDVQPVSKSVMVAPKYEIQTTDNESLSDDEENDDDSDDEYVDDTDDDTENYDNEDESTNEYNNSVKPLFDENPNNFDENIAFKPINFDMPAISSDFNTNKENPEPEFTPEHITENVSETDEEEFVAPDFSTMESQSVLESATPIEPEQQKPVLESMTPITDVPMETTPTYQEPVVNNPEEQESVVQEQKTITPVPPVVQPAPIVNTFNANVTEQTTRSKPTVVYYLLLLLLILLSIFTLWLYQKNFGNNKPVLTVNITEKTEPKKSDRFDIKKKQVKKTEVVPVSVSKPKTNELEYNEFTFADESSESSKDSEQETTYATSNSEENIPEAQEPIIMGAVTAKVLPSDTTTESDEDEANGNDVVIVNKPVYEVGSKHDNMFTAEQGINPESPAETNEMETYEEEYLEEDFEE